MIKVLLKSSDNEQKIYLTISNVNTRVEYFVLYFSSLFIYQIKQVIVVYTRT